MSFLHVYIAYMVLHVSMVYIFCIVYMFLICLYDIHVFLSKEEMASCWSSVQESSMSFLLFLATGQSCPPFENIDLWVHFSQA